jgi:hypothetical protein
MRLLQFVPGSDDERISDQLCTGDVLLFARDVTLYAPLGSAVCAARKALTGTPYDHAAIVALRQPQHWPSGTKPTNGPIHELDNPAIQSAIDVLGSLPSLYDLIYAEFPEAYKRCGGDFGRIGVVRFYEPGKRSNPKHMRVQPRTHFTEQPIKYSYPDGLIVPIVWGLRALLRVQDGKVVWVTDPADFVRRHIDSIVGAYKLVLTMSRFDPVKIGKNEASYGIAESEFEKALLKQDAAAA